MFSETFQIQRDQLQSNRTLWLTLLILMLTLLGANLGLSAERLDWPQWRGPERNGVSKETGLLKAWPKTGPQVLWQVDHLGPAYSTVSISRGRILTQANRNSLEEIICLDLKTGEIVWAISPHQGTPAFEERRGNGPRGVPTIEGEFVYSEGGSGVVSCVEFATGKQVWERDLVKDLGGKIPKWGYSESPLLDGEQLLVTPGGEGGAIVALNRKSGETLWRATQITDAAHYCSPIVAEVDGIRQYIQFTNQRLVGVRADNGDLLWDYSAASNKTANVATPIFQNGLVFASSGYGTGGGLVKLMKQGETFKAEQQYFEKSMANHHGGIVLVDGYLYGFGSNSLICMNFETGKIAWQNRSVGKGSLIYADGHLYCLGENQVLGLVEANPKEYVEKGRLELKEHGKPSWAHPVVAQGRLFIRDQETLTCYEIAEPGTLATAR